MFTIVKIIVSAAIIGIITEISRRSPSYGGLIAALPIVSMLSMVWLYIQGEGDIKSFCIQRGFRHPLHNHYAGHYRHRPSPFTVFHCRIRAWSYRMAGFLVCSGFYRKTYKQSAISTLALVCKYEELKKQGYPCLKSDSD